MMRFPQLSLFRMMLGSQEYQRSSLRDLYAIPSSPRAYSPTSFFHGLSRIGSVTKKVSLVGSLLVTLNKPTRSRCGQYNPREKVHNLWVGVRHYCGLLMDASASLFHSEWCPQVSIHPLSLSRDIIMSSDGIYPSCQVLPPAKLGHFLASLLNKRGCGSLRKCPHAGSCQLIKSTNTQSSRYLSSHTVRTQDDATSQ